MKARPPTVFIVDDNEAVRNSLQLLVKSIGLRASTLVSAQDFLNSYDAEQPGCLVLDVRMPGMNGLELQQQLNRRGAMIPVIFITGHGDIAMAVDAMQHGAFDFLQKPFSDKDLIDRIQRALHKENADRAELIERSRIRERRDSLTPRERDVLALVVVGNANKAMAGELGVSQRTIEIHRARIMEKMRASSLAHLVRMALELEETAG